MFNLRKYRGVIFHDTEESCKTWRKTDLCFGKWHEEFAEFSSEHLKASTIFLWEPFLQSRNCMSYKLREELWVMTLKNEEKSEEKLTCCFKNWYKKFDEFWLENLKISKMYTLMDCFWPNYIIFELKKYKGAIFWVWYKIWRKTDLWFGKWHEEFGKFSPEHTKFSKFQLSLDLFLQSRKCTNLKPKGEHVRKTLMGSFYPK